MNLKWKYIKNYKVAGANKFRYCESSFFSDKVKRMSGVSLYCANLWFHHFVWVISRGHKNVSGRHSNIRKFDNNLKICGSYSDHKHIGLNNVPQIIFPQLDPKNNYSHFKIIHKKGLCGLMTKVKGGTILKQLWLKSLLLNIL